MLRFRSMSAKLYVGTAAWNIPKAHAHGFRKAGSHLERYARRLTCVEINSSFYRPHKPTTYARWAASVPQEFRFAVKMPRDITHDRKLIDINDPLDRFLGEVQGLGDKLGPILLQLPPRLKYQQQVVEKFLTSLRTRFGGALACEPRHASWSEPEADAVLKRYRVARVVAHPVVIPCGDKPGGWTKLIYRRLHGSPRVYFSAYSNKAIADVADAMRNAPKGVREEWCIFDNTTMGEATGNALTLLRRLEKSS